MTQTYSNENIVNLDLWGGTHEYDKLDYTYYLNRHAGLFSNLCVCSYGLLTYYNMGFKPKNISLILTEYDDTFNFYDKLFKTSNTEINFDDISTEKFNHCLRYQEPSHLGLGREKDHINFDICKRIINKYFLLSDDTKTIIKGIIKKNKIDYNNTVFIWARKTDKIVENDVPTVDRYVDLLKEKNLLNHNIILQTDDISVYNEFNEKISCKILNEVPFSDDSKGFHVKLNLIDDEFFYSKYDMSKVEYLQKMISLVIIASKCKHVVIYPGNLSTVIPIVRGNFNNVYSFSNNINLIGEI